jgi:hypothetical protein
MFTTKTKFFIYFPPPSAKWVYIKLIIASNKLTFKLEFSFFSFLGRFAFPKIVAPRFRNLAQSWNCFYAWAHRRKDILRRRLFGRKWCKALIDWVHILICAKFVFGRNAESFCIGGIFKDFPLKGLIKCAFLKVLKILCPLLIFVHCIFVEV